MLVPAVHQLWLRHSKGMAKTPGNERHKEKKDSEPTTEQARRERKKSKHDVWFLHEG
jgi:hypothetical protein